MDIRLCEELVTLSECLNFRKAADRLFIAQSTLSKHVSAAEREAGFRIFERSAQGVELTEGGRVLVEGLRSVVCHYNRALQQARACQTKQDVTVRIAGPLLNSRIASIVSCATVEEPQNASLQVSMMEMGVRDAHEKLLSHEADIAVAFRYDDEVPGLHYEHLFSIPFGIACHAANPLASKSPLTFDDLIDAPMISYPMQEREAYHSFVREVRKRHGIETAIEHLAPDALCFPRNTESVIFGVYFPDYSRFGGDIVARPLDDDSDQFDVCVLCRADEERPAVLRLFDAIVAAARGEG